MSITYFRADRDLHEGGFAPFKSQLAQRTKTCEICVCLLLVESKVIKISCREESSEERYFASENIDSKSYRVLRNESSGLLVTTREF